MKFVRTILSVFLAFSPLVSPLQTPPAVSAAIDTAYFLVAVHNQRFVIAVTDPKSVAQAKNSITSHTRLFPFGKLASGDGGFNGPYHWHLEPESVRMVEVAAELCDGLPSAVEANLPYWLNDVRRYCPWSGRVLKQIVANKGGESHAGAASALFSTRTAKLSPTGESHALASPVINAAPVSVSEIRATMIVLPPGTLCPWVSKPTTSWPPAFPPPRKPEEVRQTFENEIALIRALELGSSLEAQGQRLLSEYNRLGSEIGRLNGEKTRVYALYVSWARYVNDLVPRYCEFFARVQQFNSQCAGRRLPPDDLNRCIAWKRRLEQEYNSHWMPRLNEADRRIAIANTAINALSQAIDRLKVEIGVWNASKPRYDAAVVAAVKSRTVKDEYEIDSSSFIQLADREPEYQRVETVLLTNRGRTYICPTAEQEVLVRDTLHRQALIQQWNIGPAEANVPVLLVEIVLTYIATDVRTREKDARIAASAWLHRRKLIVADDDFNQIPWLVLIHTKS
jgi:hypothetical protein